MSLKLFLSLTGLFFNVSFFQCFIPEKFKRLQSRVTSSGATVNTWMNFFLFIYLFFFVFILFLCIYLFIFSFLSFVCFCLFVSWLFILFLFFIGLFCCCVLLSLSFFSFSQGDFISLWVGLGLIFRWLENKICYLGAVYKFLNVGMDLVVIKELFIILYI